VEIMALTTKSDTIVLIDDEQHHVLWMIDYLESKNYKVIRPRHVGSALDYIESEIYRALIIDLNIPVSPPFDNAIRQRGGAYAKYPGLFLAERARNRGYRDRQVVIYSVHRDAEVLEEVAKLGATYILKGRPHMIKEEIDEVLSYDPTT
jgi:CheY-like chemotaxis protein